MNSEEERYYDRRKKSASFRMSMLALFVLDILFTVAAMIIQFKCSDQKDVCHKQWDKYGLTNLSEWFNLVPLISIISYFLTGFTYLIVVCKFFSLYNKHFGEYFLKFKRKVIRFTCIILIFVVSRCITYGEMIWTFDQDDEDAEEKKHLRVCRIIMQSTEIFGAIVILFITFKNYRNEKSFSNDPNGAQSNLRKISISCVSNRTSILRQFNEQNQND